MKKIPEFEAVEVEDRPQTITNLCKKALGLEQVSLLHEDSPL
jgi:hypothetical protein